MKLFLVHCGFYDFALSDGIYESHVNFFVAAEDFDGAKKKVREIAAFTEKKMHVDGIQEIVAVNGHKVSLVQDFELRGETVIKGNRHRDLASKPNT